MTSCWILVLTAASGSIYSLLLEQGIDDFWLLKIHTGRFGPINLQPSCSLVLGLLTLVVIDSGLMVLRQPPRSLSTPAWVPGRSSNS